MTPVNDKRDSVSKFISIDRTKKVGKIYPIPAVGDLISVTEHKTKVRGGDWIKPLDGTYLVEARYSSFLNCIKKKDGMPPINVALQINDFKRGAYRYNVLNAADKSEPERLNLLEVNIL